MPASPALQRIVVVGAGPAGLLLALGLDRLGFAVSVLEAQPAADILNAPFDGRAIALMYGSRRVFDGLGLWSALDEVAVPVWGVRVVDQATGAAASYDAAEVGGHPFGYGIENRVLRARLLERALARPGIEICAPVRLERIMPAASGVDVRLADGSQRHAALVVGADGRNSTIRKLARIGVERWDYRQTAITFALRHERAHDHLVREYLRPAGPLALLPIGPRESGVTWVEGTLEADRLLDLEQDELAHELDLRLAGVLGRCEILGRPSGWPLVAQRAARAAAPRIVLVGDAAHGIHPIHAQGFNLTVRDVAALLEVLADARRAGVDPGGGEPLARYERWRRSDASVVLAVTDGLNRLFSTELAPAKLIRNLGLTAIDRLPALKHFAVRRGMGVAGDLPRLARGERL